VSSTGKSPSEFAPPPEPARARSYVLAAAAHVLLFAGLGLVTRWTTQETEVSAEAELWAAVPREAAPKLQAPEPAPQPTPENTPEPPAPTPAPTPAPPPPPPKPAPPDQDDAREAEIALQKRQAREKAEKAELQRKAALEKEKLEKQKAEKARAEKEKAEKEKAAQEKAARERKAREDKAREDKARQEQAKRQAEAEKKKKEEAQAKADAQRAEALRQENLRRMQGLANATGGENATGTAERSAAPSASYAGRLVARIRPNISFPGEVAGNPRAEVEVRTAPDGTILSRRIVTSSGNRAWDDAVLRAIDKTEVLPRDTDGRVPPVIVLGFRPLD